MNLRFLALGLLIFGCVGGLWAKKKDEGDKEKDLVSWDHTLELKTGVDQGSWNEVWPLDWAVLYGAEAEWNKTLRLRARLEAFADASTGGTSLALDRGDFRWTLAPEFSLSLGWDQTPAAEELDLGLEGKKGLLSRKLGDAGFEDRRFFLSGRLRGPEKDLGPNLTAGVYFDRGQYTPLTLATLSWTWEPGNLIYAQTSYYPTIVTPFAEKLLFHRGSGKFGLQLEGVWGAFSAEAGVFGSKPDASHLISQFSGGFQSVLRIDLSPETWRWALLAQAGVLGAEGDPVRWEALAGLSFREAQGMFGITLEAGLENRGAETAGLWGLKLKVKI